jgi:hypothetical protein
LFETTWLKKTFVYHLAMHGKTIVQEGDPRKCGGAGSKINAMENPRPGP